MKNPSDGTGNCSDTFDADDQINVEGPGPLVGGTKPWPSFPTRDIASINSTKTEMHDSVFGTTSGGGQGPGAT